MGEKQEADGIQVLSLLPDFGLALFSTIAGIFCRILLQQLRNDPMDVETEAREELGNAIRQLRATIGQVVGNLSSLSQQTSVTLNELNSAVSRTLEQTASDNTQMIGTVANDISQLSERLSSGNTGWDSLQLQQILSQKWALFEMSLKGLDKFHSSLLKIFKPL